MKRKEHVNGLKHCARCDTWRPPSEFHAHRGNWDSLHAYCKPCMASISNARYVRERIRLLTIAAAWRKANPEKRKAIALRAKFGLEIPEYRRLLEAQDNLCAICKRTAELHVDHCHSTNRIRGLLCMPCNTAIGHLGDDPDRIRAAASYVAAHQ
jgi:hypothetical protein